MRVILSQWKHRSFLTLLSLIRWTIKKYALTAQQRSLGHGSEADAPSCTTETRTDCSKERNGCMLTPLPLPLCWTALYWEEAPRPRFLQWETRARVDIQFSWHVGHFLGTPTLVLPHRCGRGIYGAWSLGMRLWERRGKGITKSNAWILAVQIPTAAPKQ